MSVFWVMGDAMQHIAENHTEDAHGDVECRAGITWFFI